MVRNTACAATTLRLVKEAGRGGPGCAHHVRAAGEAWRAGFVARAIADFVRTPPLACGMAGLITAADPGTFRAIEPPIPLAFRGTTVVKAGFWSQGPVLPQDLAILDHLPDGHLDPWPPSASTALDEPGMGGQSGLDAVRPGHLVDRFPEFFASIMSTPYIPLFGGAPGIILRGTAFAIRGQEATLAEVRALGALFAKSSVLVPFCLGAAVGGIASDRVPTGDAEGDRFPSPCSTG